MSRESEVTAYLRSYAPLVALLPGGIYSAETLSDIGLTDPTTTPGAYAGGRLLTCLLVSARAPAPGLRLVDLKRQIADANQAVECWVYSRDPAAIQPILDLIYTRLQGDPAAIQSRGWPASWSFSMGPMAMPDASLGPGVHVAREDYTVVSTRRGVPAPVPAEPDGYLLDFSVAEDSQYIGVI